MARPGDYATPVMPDAILDRHTATLLERAFYEYLEHYQLELTHQGIGNALIDPGARLRRVDGRVLRRDRLGGLLRYYHRAA